MALAPFQRFPLPFCCRHDRRRCARLLGTLPTHLLALAADGTAWGALLLNSNGQEMVALADRLTFRTIGGILDLVSSIRLSAFDWS